MGCHFLNPPNRASSGSSRNASDTRRDQTSTQKCVTPLPHNLQKYCEKAAEKPSEEEEEDVRDDREDEKPTVVVLGTGDLTQEEADRWGEEKEKKDEETAIAEGKITFKKPVKRSAEEKSNLDASTSTKKRKDDKSDKKSKMKKVKNSSLLSFGDDEEEEDG
ncbi:uncharacterized protein KIAA1143 homolog isoform X1 [Branchiostoma lanceolatum]|uniref:uncharacterized protein KIAA1143 homolog isoform X1 n=1 Tax=Branchiostoma lanceolatum TaxID=7740 RepID=UPI003451A816